MDDLYPSNTIAAGLAALTRRWPEVQSNSEEEPVFVLAAGWRSGSTLVQRALMSQCQIWGEPLGHAGLIERLADPLRTVSDRWPEPHFVYRGQPLETLAREIRRQSLSAARALAGGAPGLVRCVVRAAGAGRGQIALGPEGSPACRPITRRICGGSIRGQSSSF